MGAWSYEELRAHIGHKLECVGYGGGLFPVNVAVECLTCHEVLFDYDHSIMGVEDDDPTPSDDDDLTKTEVETLLNDYVWYDGFIKEGLGVSNDDLVFLEAIAAELTRRGYSQNETGEWYQEEEEDAGTY